jgi:Flp pilus assembly protein TadD
VEKNAKQRLSVAAVIFVLAVPFAFLLYKTAPFRPGGAASPKTILQQHEDAARADPSFENCLNLGMAYINANRPDKSLEPLEKARALNPSSAAAHNNLGVAYIMLRRYDEGIAACRRALELDPSFQLAKNNLAWGLAEKEKQKKK